MTFLGDVLYRDSDFNLCVGLASLVQCHSSRHLPRTIPIPLRGIVFPHIYLVPRLGMELGRPPRRAQRETHESNELLFSNEGPTGETARMPTYATNGSESGILVRRVAIAFSTLVRHGL